MTLASSAKQALNSEGEKLYNVNLRFSLKDSEGKFTYDSVLKQNLTLNEIPAEETFLLENLASYEDADTLYGWTISVTPQLVYPDRHWRKAVYPMMGVN